MANTLAVVSNPASNTVILVDLTLQTTLATLSLTSPGEIAVLPNATEAYVTNNGGTPGNVYPIALPAYTLGTTIVTGNGPLEIVASPDGTHVYTGNNSADTITPIATPANTAGTDIPLAGSSALSGLGVNPAATDLYAVTPFAGIYPVAIPSNVVGVPFGSVQLAFNNPSSIVVMPGGTTGYVSSPSTTALWPVNFTASTVGAPFTPSGPMAPMFLQPGGSQIFGCDPLANVVIVWDTATNTQVGTVTLTGGTVSTSGGFDATGATFYACTPGSGQIFAINTSTYALGPTFSSLAGPTFLAVVPAVSTEQIVMIV